MNNMVRIKINPRSLRQPFRPCDPDFIRDVCRASCCRSSVDPSGIAHVIAPDEIQTWRDLGVEVADSGKVAAVNRRCPFQDGETHQCQIHEDPAMPKGCIISPFTINDSGTLIVRNRYRLLKCFKAEGAIPVHLAHRLSLVTLFGDEQVEHLERVMLSGDETPIYLEAPARLVDNLRHKNEVSKQTLPDPVRRR